MPALLAVFAAATFGVADFLGGLATRRAPIVAVTLLTNVAGGTVALALLLTIGGEWSVETVAWGVSGGVFGLAGLMLLYSGLAAGPNKLVSPVSAVVAAIVPVGVGIGLGDRPGQFAIVGLVLTAPAIWLLAGGDLRISGVDRRPLLMAVGAGLGFGTFFAFIAQVPDGSGAVPLLTSRLASVTILIGFVVVTRPSFRAKGWQGVSVVAGSLDMTANGLFLWSTREGELAIVGALVSLFPATTVLLAVGFLGERLTRSQAAGLALALAAAALLS